jgi:hypothetical protein
MAVQLHTAVVLKTPQDVLQSSWTWLVETYANEEEARELVLKSPGVLTAGGTSLDRAWGVLLEVCGSCSRAKELAASCPGVLKVEADIMLRSWAAMQKLCGSSDHARQLVEANPGVLTTFGDTWPLFELHFQGRVRELLLEHPALLQTRTSTVEGAHRWLNSKFSPLQKASMSPVLLGIPPRSLQRTWDALGTISTKLQQPEILSVPASTLQATWPVLIDICGGSDAKALALVQRGPSILSKPGFQVRAAWAQLLQICGSEEAARDALRVGGPEMLEAPVLQE